MTICMLLPGSKLGPAGLELGWDQVGEMRIYLTGMVSVQQGARRGDGAAARLVPRDAYQQLMLAHAAAGNQATALLAYERCRARLAAELGTARARRCRPCTWTSCGRAYRAPATLRELASLVATHRCPALTVR